MGVCGGVVSSRMPAKAMAAPAKTAGDGARMLAGRSAGMEQSSGTMTTIRPVMKADLAGVVRARPAVWKL